MLKNHRNDRFALCLSVLILSLSGVLSGCGAAPADQMAQSNSTANGLPSISIPAHATTNAGDHEEGEDDLEAVEENGEYTNLPEPENGTPEWNLKQIALKRAQLSMLQGQALNEEQKSRFEKTQYEIIDLATGAIAMCHNNPEKKRVFDAAAHALTDVRVALATSGHQDQIDAIYDDAEALYKRDPNSQTSANAFYAIVRMSEKFAQVEQSNPRWMLEFTRAARTFTVRFPKEESRAALALLSAGRLSETRHDYKTALECYSLVASSYPQSPYAAQVAGTIRRLSVDGKPIDLGGPTIDGGFASIQDYAGKNVLIIFWDSQSPEFMDSIDQLLPQVQALKNQGIEILCVNFDQDEVAVDHFLERYPLPGPQIFPLEPEHRGYSSPIARFYGIRSTPAIWLVGKNGALISSRLHANDLSQAVSQHLASGN
jgi:tetratricopeptide (TPR) repeat protein